MDVSKLPESEVPSTIEPLFYTPAVAPRYQHDFSQLLLTRKPGADTLESSPTPPHGWRYTGHTSKPFPPPNISGPPPFRDVDGEPVFIGSSLIRDEIHPCKLAPHLYPPCRVAYGGIDFGHEGFYDLLPITEDHEWVHASKGRIPEGRRPVDAGYRPIERLHHAYAVIDGCSVPGTASEELAGVYIPFDGREIYLKDRYWILCWRD